MAIAAITEFAEDPTGASPEELYDRVCREFNDGRPMTRPSDWGPGLLSHIAGRAESGRWWVVDVWESQDAMDRFMARMMPVIQPHMEERGAGEPTVTVLAVHNLVTEGKAAAAAGG
jgi:hypothetical protein